MKKYTFTFMFLLITIVTFSQSKLIFSYDSASNQVERKYCKNGDCTTAKSANKKEEVIQEQLEDIIAENVEFDESLAIFPNPTKGLLTIKWSQNYNNSINEILLIDISSKTHQVPYVPGNHEANIDLSSWPIGLYIVRFFLTDGSTLTKKIIKK
jgi:hypothetical protein